jgi:hypothetical protein
MNDHDEAGDLWVANCICGAEWHLDEKHLREDYPDNLDVFDTGEFAAQCNHCHSIVNVTRVNVKVVPFSAWTILPPMDGCGECGHEHPPELPHNPHSLTYQYTFRLREAQAGRPERWPTWSDAMAHCTESMRQDWIQALSERGVTEF